MRLNRAALPAEHLGVGGGRFCGRGAEKIRAQSPEDYRQRCTICGAGLHALLHLPATRARRGTPPAT